MFNSKKKAGVLVSAVAIVVCLIVPFNIDTLIEAQTPERTIRVSTPGYYYVKPADVAQDAQTAAIMITLPVVRKYLEGLQIVFKTEVANTNNANVTLQIGTLGAKRLLTRHGQEFQVLELDTGVIMTATYDGTDFISDYVAARSLKGRLIASLNITTGDYGLFEYFEGWTVETGVTEVGTANLPAGLFVGNADEKTNALLTLPKERIKGSQLGWYIEVLNGTTVIDSRLKTFGESSAFAGRISTDNVDINLFQHDHAAGTIAGVTESVIAFSVAEAATIPAGYSIKFYISEN